MFGRLRGEASSRYRRNRFLAIASLCVSRANACTATPVLRIRTSLSRFFAHVAIIEIRPNYVRPALRASAGIQKSCKHVGNASGETVVMVASLVERCVNKIIYQLTSDQQGRKRVGRGTWRGEERGHFDRNWKRERNGDTTTGRWMHPFRQRRVLSLSAAIEVRKDN